MQLISKTLVLIAFLLSSFSGFGEVSIDLGKQLFKANCAQCHNRNMKDKLTGPALGGFQDRWAGKDAQLYAWIRNSQAVIASGDPYAVALYNEWNKVLMTPNPNLTDDDIASIFSYVDAVYTGKEGGSAAPAGGVAVNVPQPKTNYGLIYGVLALLLALIAIVMARIISNLDHMHRVAAGETDLPRQTLSQILTSRAVVAFVIFAVIVLGGYTTVNSAIAFGRQQNYEPEQPIKFLHSTHAGVHKIDCQYCHDGARRSKHAVVPSTNTCMNCHKAIKKGTMYGTAELTKIFVSVGFDPTTDKYIENYESLPIADVEKIYKKWMSDSYVADKELVTLDNKGEAVVKEQWEEIVNALTSDSKKDLFGPIEWVRVHNLPDHVYFNHAQHVSIGKVTCQQCHGKVEEMDKLKQYSTLSMGWCINCHRQTEVKFAENEYYKSYEQYHKELASGKRDKVTVEEIGGTECQKCHY